MARPAPPPGPPWDLPIGQVPLAFVDLEMTGLDPQNDYVVEVCVDRVVGQSEVCTFTSLVRPPIKAGGAAQVHGLDAAALEGAPSFPEIAEKVLRVLDGSILVAHAAEWDVRFLKAELGRAGIAFQSDFYLDTLVLARRAFAFENYSLDALCKSLSIERGQAHRAKSDVLAMRVLFERCLESLAPASARDLWEVRIAQRRARPAIVQACESAVKHGVAVLVTYRPSGRAPEDITMILTAVRADLDPPRVIGYQLPGRGRREFRADRVLRVDPAPPSTRTI